jgi:hypothetical protein
VRRLLVLSTFALAVPVAAAQDPLPKHIIVDQSGGICRDLNEDALPHARRMNRSDSVNEAVGNHADRARRAAKRYGLRRSCIRYVS